MSTSRPSRTGRRRPYFPGQKVQLTPEWKVSVTRRLDELGRSRAWLAEQLGVDRAAITRMLAPTQNTSSMAPKISSLLGIQLPVIPAVQAAAQADDAEVLSLLSQLLPDDKVMVRELIARLSKKSHNT